MSSHYPGTNRELRCELPLRISIQLALILSIPSISIGLTHAKFQPSGNTSLGESTPKPKPWTKTVERFIQADRLITGKPMCLSLNSYFRLLFRRNSRLSSSHTQVMRLSHGQFAQHFPSRNQAHLPGNNSTDQSFVILS